MSDKYDASSIKVLSGLDPVRKRPGMYTDTTRPNHLIHEVVDNSVDEAIAGHADKIIVTLHADGAIEVSDNGRGMPVDIHPDEGVSGVEVILTKLHAGGKFSDENYQFSGGLHGVGISVVNALSTMLKIWVKRDGAEHFIEFADGLVQKPLTIVNKVGKLNTGTKILFYPDASFFDSPNVSIPRLIHNLRAKAVLQANLTMELVIEKTGETTSWLYKDGLSEYLKTSLNGIEYIPDEIFSEEYLSDDMGINWAIVWTAPRNDLVTESYVNLVPTFQGGTHVNGVRTGLTESIREFCDFRDLLPRGLKIAPDDVWDRVSYVVSVKMVDPQFAGQTKERLSSREVASKVAQVIKDSFSLWLNQNHIIGEKIAQLAIDNAQERTRKAKKISRKKITSGPALPGKLADCSLNDIELTELFLVEGDSAGGSAKQARNRETQAIMSLRGKILNTWEVNSSDVMASNEVHDISVALGVLPGEDDISGLRYGKICVLADADSDGAHIATLLCALFLRHFKPLVEQGHIYISMPPLFRIDAGKQVFYALDDNERQQIINKITQENKRVKPSVQRFKGLGEMNPSQLRETAMNPDTRRLVRLTSEFGDGGESMLDMLLAKKRAADRKSWLESKGNLAKV